MFYNIGPLGEANTPAYLDPVSVMARGFTGLTVGMNELMNEDLFGEQQVFGLFC